MPRLRLSAYSLIMTFLPGLAFCLSIVLMDQQLKISAGEKVSQIFCSHLSNSGCRTLALSPYSEIFPGFSLSFLAVAYFLVWTIIGILRWIRKSDVAKRNPPDHLLFGISGAIFSSYYLWVMFGILHTFCWMCFSLHISNFVIVFLHFKQSIDERINFKKFKIIPEISALIATALLSIFLYLHYSHSPPTRRSHYQIQTESAPGADLSRFDFKINPGEPRTKTLVMAIDLTCPFCKESLVNLAEAATALRISISAKLLLFPLDRDCNGNSELKISGSCSATRVAICQSSTEKFSAFVQGAIMDRAKLVDNAAELIDGFGIDQASKAALLTCTQLVGTDAELHRLLDIASGNGNHLPVRSLPTAWINGKRVVGLVTAKEWISLLEGNQNFEDTI